MCGLVGIWRRDRGEADRSVLTAMLETIGHRGPDGTGSWQEGHVALGHARLSIIDLTEASRQPMLTEDGTAVLIYNGEVYNYRELRKELESEGVRFRSSGDTEVVLQALHVWGPERSVKRFNGSKWLVKQAAADVLPRDIVYAKKEDFRCRVDFGVELSVCSSAAGSQI